MTAPDDRYQLPASLAFRGRRAELETLDRLLDRAVDYHAPQLVTLVGGQGIGKSRLLAEWLARVAVRADPAVRALSGRARPNGKSHALVTDLLRERFAVLEGEPPEQVMAKVRAGLEALFVDRRVAEIVHFLGRYLDVTPRTTPFLSAIGDHPTHRDPIARTVLTRFLELDAERSPLVLAFDDLHHADPDTVSLLGEIADGLGGSPVMLVALAQPELMVTHPRWGSGSADHTRIDIEPLGRADSEAALRELMAGVEAAPPSLIARAAELSSGNPQHMQELVRGMADRGVFRRGEHGHSIDPERAAAMDLPVTVERAVEARVATLAREERELLEMGAIFGNVFWAGALVCLRRLEEGTRDGEGPHLDDGRRAGIEWLLGDLVERGFLLRIPDSTIPGEPEYVFTHNLERELLARTTPPDRARRFHHHGAQWVERGLEEHGEEQLEFLAALYARGGSAARAALAYTKAGDLARARGAHETALALHERALELTLGDDALARIATLRSLGEAAAALGRTHEAIQRFEEMRRSAWLLDAREAHDEAARRIAELRGA